MPRRTAMVFGALLLAAASAVVPISGAAQAVEAAGTRQPGPSYFDAYGGYAYFRPELNTYLDGFAYQPIEIGGVASIAGYFDRHFGLQAEGQISPYGPNDCFYTAQGGPIFRFQAGRMVPFFHALGGGVRIGGPAAQPCIWGLGMTAGLGVDFILPALHNHLAIRPIQADFLYTDANFGANTPPTNANGGVAKMSAYRLSAGLVLRLGEILPEHPASFGCEAQPANIYPGDPVTVTGRAINLEVNKRMTPVYTWSTAGGTISGKTETVIVSTAGLAAGDYTVTGRVSEGPKPSEHADCTASFRVHGYDPPTIACSANPNSILPGGFSTIAAEGRSPQNRPLNYSYGTTAGQITGTGGNATLAAADVSPGMITISCNVVDDLGQLAKAATIVTVEAPPPPPAPAARDLCSISFERDRKRPMRVDNEAKGCLDDIALELNREADAVLVVVGKHDPQEKPDAAAERTLNVKQYLTQEKGIDPSRIQLRTGETTGRSADDVLVPTGATWDPGGTSSFDPARVARHGEPYAPVPR